MIDFAFTENQLLYLPYGQIRTNPAGVLREVEHHCNLSRQNYRRLYERIHTTKPFQLPEVVLDSLLNSVVEQNKFLESRFGKTFFKSIA